MMEVNGFWIVFRSNLEIGSPFKRLEQLSGVESSGARSGFTSDEEEMERKWGN
jgi:hypothetical protein